MRIYSGSARSALQAPTPDDTQSYHHDRDDQEDVNEPTQVCEETRPSTHRMIKTTATVSSILAGPYVPLTRMSFWTDFTPGTLRAMSTAFCRNFCIAVPSIEVKTVNRSAIHHWPIMRFVSTTICSLTHL